MEPERRRQMLLGILTILLVVMVYRVWPRTSAPAVPSSNTRGEAAPAPRGAPSTPAAARAAGATVAAARGPQTPGAPDVHLEALNAERPKPASADRNLFRFKPKAPPPPPPGARQPPPMPVPAGPPEPAPPPPITLKFIGFVDRPPGQPKIALLRDAQGNVFRGSEGETVEGRWRILHIGVESIEMAYIDGRGRQTIRLTGS